MMYKSRIAETSCMSFRKLEVALGLKLKYISDHVSGPGHFEIDPLYV